MANSLGTRLARIDVLIGGADQAKKKLEEMKNELKKLKDASVEAQEK